MKIRYIALIAIVSLLSMGTITGCSTTSSTVETASKTNPCASKVNPCASKANPCASKANPCASKANPCASKAKTSGGALAAELQGKPVIVDIYASWCPACKNVAPALATLKNEYKDKAHFVVLDVSDQATLAKSTATAKALGLEQFLTKNQSNTGLIAIIDPANSSVLLEKQNNADVATYKQTLDAFKAKS
jgi:thiol-disulfide isomerase/thioredoxin